MGIRTVQDPYGHGSGLVDKLIGSAYDVVRYVACNLDAIKFAASQFSNMQTSPGNGVYTTTAGLAAAPLTRLAVTLAESGKAGSFVVREAVDYAAEIGADEDEQNFILSTEDPAYVWVRIGILPADGFLVPEAIAADIPTPAPGFRSLFFDTAGGGVLKAKDDSGTVTTI